MGLIVGSLFLNHPLIAIIISFIVIFKNRKYKYNIMLFLSMFLYWFLLMMIASHTIQNNINKTMLIVEAKDNYIIVRDAFRKYYISIKNNYYEVGDLLRVNGNLSRLKMHSIESHFNFQKYLENKGIYYEVNAYSIDTVFRSLFPRRRIIDNWVNNYDSLSKELIKSFLFGMSRGEYLKEYSNTSLAFFLGLNNYLLTTLFFGISNLISKKFLRSELITFLILLPYLIFIFDKACFLRLVVYLIVFKCLRKKYHITYNNCIMIVILIYLIISPFNIFNEGLIIPIILSVFFKLIKSFKIKKIIKIFLIALVIYFISIIKDNLIMLLSPLQRMILLPIIFLFFVCSMLFVPIGLFPNFINLLSKTLFNTFDFMAQIDIKIYLSPNAISNFFLALLILVILYGCYIQYKKIIQKMFISIFVCTIILSSNIHNYIFDYMFFIDVGQGDCALLIHKNKSLLIDTGGLSYEDLAMTTLIPFFKRYHLKEIDTVICSHSDFDHVGALVSLKENFKIKNVISSRESFPYNFYGIKIENLNNYYGKDTNDNSLINYFTFMNKTFLFMGDASFNIEKQIVRDYDLSSVDVLKASHHGSKTGSSDNLLSEISPCEAIISLGFNNIYKFPSDEVIDRFNKYQIKVRRTDIEGTIIYKKISF